MGKDDESNNRPASFLIGAATENLHQVGDHVNLEMHICPCIPVSRREHSYY